MLAWGLIGWLVDRSIGTDHVFLGIGIVLGGALGIYIVYLRYGKDDRDERLSPSASSFAASSRSLRCVVVVAALIGWLIGGADAAWSAGIAIVIVTGNFVAFALSIAWAAPDLADHDRASSRLAATSCA